MTYKFMTFDDLEGS